MYRAYMSNNHIPVIIICITIIYAIFTALNLNNIVISILAYQLTQEDMEEIRDNLMEVRLSLQKGDLIEALQHLNNVDENLLLIQTTPYNASHNNITNTG